jgi:sirohydrochlorin cobaltochelatase
MIGRSFAGVLVGHGGLPRDFPRELVAELKHLERSRRDGHVPPSRRESELEQQLRHWPRTPESDPYRFGLDEIAEALRARLGDTPLYVAFNEFCAPSVAEALTAAVSGGARRVIVIPSMLTPGGSHSEVEIPESIARVQKHHPSVEIVYAWPFEPALVADLLLNRIRATDDPEAT